ncbi:hypothetical protein NDU88_004204 [Pleurodeles waltl]|uniref:Secreted protein n=1 Tax=Pleurodeles waltl TaxID=8319 RepID=A0AAV7M8K1_PLEWA|nr:hypothetical protein NDU88_004204 [Pleurodeles waltl]
MRVVTAPAVPAACSACSLPLRARHPRSSEDATPPLFPGLIGLGRVASFLPCVPLPRGPWTWFRVAAVVGVEGHRTRCVVRLSSRPVAPPGPPRRGALALSGHLVSWPGHAPLAFEL